MSSYFTKYTLCNALDHGRLRWATDPLCLFGKLVKNGGLSNQILFVHIHTWLWGLLIQNSTDVVVWFAVVPLHWQQCIQHSLHQCDPLENLALSGVFNFNMKKVSNNGAWDHYLRLWNGWFELWFVIVVCCRSPFILPNQPFEMWFSSTVGWTLD